MKKALLISDLEYPTKTYQSLSAATGSFLKEKGFDTEQLELKGEKLAFCTGCFGCWIKTPGECVINDQMAQINRSVMNSNLVIYLSPIVFGQFSPNIKNIIDRGLPNMLPFFETRPDGSTMHPPRYETYPKQIIIGYADQLSDPDQQLFIDITKNHRRNVEVLIYHETTENLGEILNSMELERVGGLL